MQWVWHWIKEWRQDEGETTKFLKGRSLTIIKRRWRKVYGKTIADLCWREPLWKEHSKKYENRWNLIYTEALTAGTGAVFAVSWEDSMTESGKEIVLWWFITWRAHKRAYVIFIKQKTEAGHSGNSTVLRTEKTGCVGGGR